MARKILETEQKVSRKEASEKLHSLADKLNDGEIELKSGTNSVKLQPAEQVEFEIEVEEEEDGDKSLEIEIEWNEKEGSEEIKIQ